MAQTKAQLVVGLNVNASAPASALQIDASGNVNLDSNTLYVDATNNRVGIGISSPSTLFHCAGTARIGANDANDAELQIGAGATGNRPAYIDLVGDTTYTDYGLRVIRNSTGANANSLIAHRGTGDLQLNALEAGAIGLFTNDTQRLRITSAGNVGVGTTSPGATLDVNGAINASSGATTDVTLNYTGTAVPSGGNNQALYAADRNIGLAGQYASLNFVTTNGAPTTTAWWMLGRSDGTNDQFSLRVRRGQTSGSDQMAYSVVTTGADSAKIIDSHRWFTNGSERARIDSSGRLLVGTSTVTTTANTSTNNLVAVESTNNYVGVSFTANCNDANGSYLVLKKSRGTSTGSTTVVQSGDEIGNIFFEGTDGSASRSAAAIRVFVDGTPGASDMPGRLVFSTTADGASSPTERMRITQDGRTLLNYGSSTSIESEVFGVQGTTTLMGRFTNNTNTSGYHGIRASIGSNGNNTSTYHFSGNTQGVNNWYLYGNGTTSYSSDERLKKNIETTRDGYLDDLKQLRVVKYNWKNHEDGTPKELGLIAQEVEQIFPGLVQDDLSPVSDEDPTIYKQLKGSVLPVILLKALQEAAEKIETLEARLSALESA